MGQEAGCGKTVLRPCTAPKDAPAFVGGGVFAVVRDFQPRALGKKADSVGIVEIFDLHREIDDAAALVAAEAVVDALVRRNREGGRFSEWNGQRPNRLPPLRVRETYWLTTSSMGLRTVSSSRNACGKGMEGLLSAPKGAVSAAFWRLRLHSGCRPIGPARSWE